nr:uncharacterized protein LOC114823388 [Malus domestica]
MTLIQQKAQSLIGTISIRGGQTVPEPHNQSHTLTVTLTPSLPPPLHHLSLPLPRLPRLRRRPKEPSPSSPSRPSSPHHRRHPRTQNRDSLVFDNTSAVDDTATTFLVWQLSFSALLLGRTNTLNQIVHSVQATSPYCPSLGCQRILVLYRSSIHSLRSKTELTIMWISFLDVGGRCNIVILDVLLKL